MSRPHRRIWWVFGGCAAAVMLAMLWVSNVVLDLENAEAQARSDAEHQTALRLAMWRMDSWLAPQLAREAGRPYFEYRSYYPQRLAYTKVLARIEEGEVLTPSPLLTYRSDIFRLHFQLDDSGTLSSPQVPTSNERDLAETSAEAIRQINTSAQELDRLRDRINPQAVSALILGAEQRIQESFGCVSPWEVEPQQSALQIDYQSRVQTANHLNILDPRVGNEHGPLLPIWIRDSATTEPMLAYMRRVRLGKETLIQGILVDWPRLAAALLATTAGNADALQATLLPSTAASPADEVSKLAAVPAILDARQPVTSAAAWSTSRTVLAAAWLGMLLAVIAVGITLRSTIALGERRARFASAVTHELRTPLTTFRMYSEMLADSMIQSPEQRAEYLATLKSEADRLSRLVENVLCFSQLEEGRYRGRRERIGVDVLVDRARPILKQRTTDAGMTLHTDCPPGPEVHIDVDAITQILFNLIDNACKYASEGGRVDICAAIAGSTIELSIEDHGGGIPSRHHAAVFRPFERGARAAGDNATPGVGLGLALARGLARDQGASLHLDASATGARFVLRIPRVDSAG